MSSLAAFSSPSSDRSARARASLADRAARDHASKNVANAAKNAAANRFARCRIAEPELVAEPETVAAPMVGTIVVGAGAGAGRRRRTAAATAPPAAQPRRGYRSDDAAAEGRGNANVAPRSNAEPRESFAAREGDWWRDRGGGGGQGREETK